MARITVALKSDELDALILLGENEFRDPRLQAALIIRRELERRGLLLVDRAGEEVGKVVSAASAAQAQPAAGR